ncbi:MAG: cyclodeaminase/cyclohydrolase family protein [Desulfobacterales bacterium]|nr:cyclodeaminase/cyclohydrolase family protein [Desulfobacterales bacterium]
MLINMQVTELIDELASDSPAPGGGSISALNGSLGAGLVAMVTRLTIGKKGFENVETAMVETRDKADGLKARLAQLVDEDTQAFNAVMAGFKMPKSTDGEKAARSAAIQAGYKQATATPMETAEKCLAVLELAQAIAGKANPNTASDLGVAGQVAYAGVEGAVMNVKINLPAIKDTEWREAQAAKTDDLLRRAAEARDGVSAAVAKEIG